MRAMYLPATKSVAHGHSAKSLVLRSLAHFTPVSFIQWSKVEELFRSQKPAQEIVDALENMLAKDLPLNAKESGGAAGRTLIEMAAAYQCEPALLHLLKKDPTLVTAAGTTFQVCRGMPGAISYLLESGYTLEREFNNGANLVKLFFDLGNTESIKLLAGAGLNLDVQFSRGGANRWAISHCVTGLPAEFLEAFVQGGANLRPAEKGGYSLYHLAVDDPLSQASQRMDAPVLPGMSSQRAMLDGANPVELLRQRVAILQAAGLPIDLANDDGETALHFALKRGYTNKAIALLELGANPDLQEKKGRTPIQLARACRRKETAETFGNALAAHRALAAIKRATSGILSHKPG